MATTKPMYDKFLDNLGLLEQDIYNSEFDITNIKGASLILGILEATKKLLRMKNPKLTEDQADMIVTPKQALEQKRKEREERRRQKEEEKALTDDEKAARSQAEKDKRKQAREERRRKREELAKKRIDEYKKFYDDLVKQLKKEVKQIITNIKEAAINLWKGFKEMIKGIALAIVQVASAIAAIVIIIALPPWNIPLSISHMIKVVEQYLGLIALFKNILPWLKPFRMLPLVCDKKNLKIIAMIFNPIIQGIRAFWIPIRKLYELINKLISKVMDFINKNKNKIFRKATRQLKKLGHLYRNWFIHPGTGELLPGKIRGDQYYTPQDQNEYPCYFFEEENIDEIQGLLDTFVVGFEGDKNNNRVVAYRKKASFDGKELSDLSPNMLKVGDSIDFSEYNIAELADMFSKLDDGTKMPNLDNLETIEDEDRFIYDIELPDGTIIKNISEEGIEYYRQNYILRYIDATARGYKQALELI